MAHHLPSKLSVHGVHSSLLDTLVGLLQSEQALPNWLSASGAKHHQTVAWCGTQILSIEVFADSSL